MDAETTVLEKQQANHRKVELIIDPQKTSDGAGVSLKRSLGSHKLPTLDPFLLLDEFRSDDPNDYIAGFPSHPHRGFETVTYMLAGKMQHKDSKGNTGLIESGGVQWMTAGRGIIHSEMPMQDDGLMWGFQIWVNLPAKQKMKEPNYQDIDPKDIPQIELQNGITIKVIAGESYGTPGVVKGIDINPLFLDIKLPSGTKIDQPIPMDHQSLVYVFKGSGWFGAHDSNAKELLSASQLGVLSTGDMLSVEAGSDGVRFIILSGKPLNEPVAKYGPFVMNTHDEIEQAIRDYQSGKFDN